MAATRRRGNIYGYTRRPDAGISGKSRTKVNGAQALFLAQLRCDSPPHVAVRAATSAARSPPPAARARAHVARTRSALRRRQRRAFTLFIHDFNYIRPFQPLPTRSRRPPPPHPPPPLPRPLPAALPRPLPHLPPYTPARSRTRSTISSLEEDTLIKLHARLSICVAACMRLILVLVVGIRGVVSPLVVPHNFVLISS